MGCTLQLAIVIHIVMLLQISYACITKPEKHLTIAAGSLLLTHNVGHSTSNKYLVTL